MIKAKSVDSLLLVLAALTAAAIAVLSFAFFDGTSVIITVPLYISVIIIFLQSGVNRFAFLLGAVNSLFYAAVYVYDGLYLTAVYAALFSFPVQLLTFFRWKRKDGDGKTVFRKMSLRQRLLISVLFCVCFAVLFLFLKHIGSNYGFYDTLSMLFGILVTLLCAVPYIEYSPLQVTSVAVGLFMFAKMARSQPLQYTYLAYQCYCMICVMAAMIRIIKIYRRQNNKNNFSPQQTVNGNKTEYVS